MSSDCYGFAILNWMASTVIAVTSLDVLVMIDHVHWIWSVGPLSVGEHGCSIIKPNHTQPEYKVIH